MPSADDDAAGSRRRDNNRQDSWADRLIRPRSSTRIQLGLRNLYILPTSFGWLWLLSCAALYWMGIVYDSSGALLLAYGGLGLFLLAPFLTQFNLQGLELQCGEPAGGFARQPLRYPLRVVSRCDRLQLRIWFRQESAAWCGTLTSGQSNIALPWTPTRRGLQRPGRLRLESRAPLGLFVCWSLWEPETAQLIYPARRPGPVDLINVERAPLRSDQRVTADHQGSEEWQELAPHRPEEGAGRIAWKQLARSGNRLSKRFRDPWPKQPLLTPAAGLPLEDALEHLCEACCRLSVAAEPFGLVLGETVLPVATGESHRQRCLELLAGMETRQERP